MRRSLAILAIVLVLFVLGWFISAGYFKSRTSELLVKLLAERFESEVKFSSMQVSLFPRVRVVATGVVLRHKGRRDVPPLIQIRRLSVDASLRTLLRVSKDIRSVQMEGLEIHVPPRAKNGEEREPDQKKKGPAKFPFLIGAMVSDDAQLIILRAKPNQVLRTFLIHHLRLESMSLDRASSFHATLTNPIPRGEIETGGEFGPWVADEPSLTPVSGTYTFSHANLATVPGVAGILSSQGNFTGRLDSIEVQGYTETPDFHLRVGGNPLALHTDFSVIVDGTDGNTILKSISAQFLRSSLVASGEVVASPDPRRPRIVLEVTAHNSRIEDLLRLAVKSDPPPMTGSVDLRTKFVLPSGDEDLVDRLKLKGEFGVGAAQFTSAKIQEKVDTLSRKGQGAPTDTDIRSVIWRLRGGFGAENGVVTFSNLSFEVAGASIQLNGTYNLDTEMLDFHGTMKLKAKLSHTTTGIKSFFLKAADPFFAGKDAGTILPVKITGARSNPSFGLDRGHESHPHEQ